MRISHSPQGIFFEYFRRDPEPLKRASVTLAKLMEQSEHKVNFDTIEWVRPFDLQSQSCRRFELKAGDRVFLFEAASNHEMMVWIKSINMVIDMKVLENTPEEVRKYDEEGERAFRKLIGDKIHDIVVPDDSKEPLTFKDHLIILKKLSTYLRNEIELKIIRSKRFEIMRAGVDVFVASVDTYLRSFLHEDNPVYKSGKLGDLHSLITILTKLDDQILQVYFGPDIDQTSCPLIDEKLPSICARYLNGSKDPPLLEGAVHNMRSSCIHIVQQLLDAPHDAIKARQDNILFTECPIDVWTLFNEHMSLVKKQNHLFYKFSWQIRSEML